MPNEKIIFVCKNSHYFTRHCLNSCRTTCSNFARTKDIRMKFKKDTLEGEMFFEICQVVMWAISFYILVQGFEIIFRRVL